MEHKFVEGPQKFSISCLMMIVFFSFEHVRLNVGP